MPCDKAELTDLSIRRKGHQSVFLSLEASRWGGYKSRQSLHRFSLGTTASQNLLSSFHNHSLSQ